LHFDVLGPLRVAAGDSGTPPVVSAPRLRTVLAVLLWQANQPVPVDELADLVWDGAPPAGAGEALRALVMRLRRGLGQEAAARIVTRAPGYAIEVSRDELDASRFETLTRQADDAVHAGRWADAARAAAGGLVLWRSTPLADVPSQRLRDQWVPVLEQLHVQALACRIEADLQEGRHVQLIPQLRELTARHPLREDFHGQLMRALVLSGQRAEALAAYQEARRTLAAELGVDPGPELRRLHERVLAGDASLTAPVGLRRAAPLLDVPAEDVPGTAVPGALAGFADVLAAEAPPGSLAGAAAPARPEQLPAGIADFTGRQAQTACLYSALTGQEVANGPGAVRVAVVAGAAGTGKTTLALHVAHQVRELFPDGQLYVRLSGASAQPAVPGEVLARLLRDLGADGDKIPAGEEERAAQYRTRLAGRRVLIVLDDARDAAQVRPLLPGSASCAVLVTSRNKTPNLLSTGFVDLGALPETEALKLFSRVVGDARPAAEPGATAEILLACAGLPLAVRISAARLATRRQWRIATMAARLRDERQRLDELRIGDLEVRASFQVSYDNLRAGRPRSGPARAFRLLGLWQGQQISLPAAAALTGEREEDLVGALEALVDASLLEPPAPDRYQLHDLLRLFATERAQAEETQEARLATVTRLLQWYLATAAAAADVLAPSHYRIPGDDPPPAGPPPDSAQDALAWYDSEYVNMIAAARQAAAAGLHDAAWRLPTAWFPHFSRRHNWADCITAHRIAVSSASASRSRLGRAWALHNLGYGLLKLRDPEAFDCLQEASALRQEAGDTGGEARTEVGLVEAHYRINGPQSAYDNSLRCLELLRNAGDPALLGGALNNHGEFCLALGKADEATSCLQEALGLWTAIGGGSGHGNVLENLGRIHLESGRFPEAIASLSEAHRLQQAEGDLLGQADALKYLGEAQRGDGRADLARKSLERALAMYTDLKAAAEVEDVRSLLAALALGVWRDVPEDSQATRARRRPRRGALRGRP
jgi:DNA-binding SARP family transcriptional activator/tetratricopeptide (TPR) repeat protein